jgi:hypothetical protein
MQKEFIQPGNELNPIYFSGYTKPVVQSQAYHGLSLA